MCYNFKDSWHKVVFVKMYLFALKSKEVQHLQTARNHKPIIQGTFELCCQNHQKSFSWTAPIQRICVLICKSYRDCFELYSPQLQTHLSLKAGNPNTPTTVWLETKLLRSNSTLTLPTKSAGSPSMSDGFAFLIQGPLLKTDSPEKSHANFACLFILHVLFTNAHQMNFKHRYFLITSAQSLLNSCVHRDDSTPDHFLWQVC